MALMQWCKNHVRFWPRDVLTPDVSFVVDSNDVSVFLPHTLFW